MKLFLENKILYYLFKIANKAQNINYLNLMDKNQGEQQRKRTIKNIVKNQTVENFPNENNDQNQNIEIFINNNNENNNPTIKDDPNCQNIYNILIKNNIHLLIKL